MAACSKRRQVARTQHRALLCIVALNVVVSLSGDLAAVPPSASKDILSTRSTSIFQSIICRTYLRGGAGKRSAHKEEPSDFNEELGSEEAEYLAKLTGVPFERKKSADPLARSSAKKPKDDDTNEDEEEVLSLGEEGLGFNFDTKDGMAKAFEMLDEDAPHLPSTDQVRQRIMQEDIPKDMPEEYLDQLGKNHLLIIPHLFFIYLLSASVFW